MEFCNKVQNRMEVDGGEEDWAPGYLTYTMNQYYFHDNDNYVRKALKTLRLAAFLFD